MPSYIDRLEDNLNKKTGILDNILESDRRFEDNFNPETSEFEEYDAYLDDQNSYMAMLDELDQEYDEIYSYLSEHRNEVDILPPARKKSVNDLAAGIGERIQAVNALEIRIKSISDQFFENRKQQIAGTRKNARMIQNHYRSMPSAISSEDSILNITN